MLCHKSIYLPVYLYLYNKIFQTCLKHDDDTFLKFLFALASSLFSHRGLVRTELSPHGNAKSLGLDLGARTDDFIREQFAKLSFAVDGRTRSKRARLIWENDLSEPNYC